MKRAFNNNNKEKKGLVRIIKFIFLVFFVLVAVLQFQNIVVSTQLDDGVVAYERNILPDASKRIDSPITRSPSYALDKVGDSKNQKENDQGDHAGGSRECVVFVHLPKVGGRTLRGYFREVAIAIGYKVPLQNVYGDGTNFVKDPKKYILTNKTVTVGHYTTRIFDVVPELRSCFKIIMLRQPIDRVISAFYYHGHKIDEVNDCFFENDSNDDNKNHNITCPLQWQYKDDVTRRIAGLEPTHWMSYMEDNNNVSAVTKRHLQVAKTNLHTKYDLVCFLDDLQSCAEQIEKKFPILKKHKKISETMKTTKDNKYKTAAKPDSKDALFSAKVKDVNQLDIELYEYALQHFATEAARTAAAATTT